MQGINYRVNHTINNGANYITQDIKSPTDKHSDLSVKQNNITTFYNTSHNKISFKGFSPKYYSAKQYLERTKEVLEFLPPRNTDLYDFSLNRLDGIQEGIKVFDGLNMKEIAFISRTMTEIGVNRGCHNMCSHCYADAKPPIRETTEQINKMSWNDFKSLTDGFSELNNRLGFYATAPEVNKTKRAYISPFHDADGLDVELKDYAGIEHDFTDISNELYKATGLPLVFDTAGWTPTNQKMQKRAEKIVKYYSNPENMNKLLQFNISLNPFHALHTRQIILERTGNTEKAEKFKNLYESRMANAIFTCTPLLKNEKMGFIQRVATSKESTFDGFREDDLKNMQKGIISKLRTLYEKDLEGEQKFIKKPLDIELNISDVIGHMREHVSAGLTMAERGQKYFGESNRHAAQTKDNVFHATRTVRDSVRAKDILLDKFSGIVDANGKYYLTSWEATFPTELKLNFENSDKLTAPIRPFFQEGAILKKSVINNV